ncbi:MAG: Uma2 family endonuclease [Deltaproteobacteria bacterium]|nr:Uma2 family endonuclease [Deltaproteobacteria bacterium]
MVAVVAPTLYRFTRDEYYRMGEAGLFIDKRVELLDGEIITMPPQNPPHAGTTNHIGGIFIHLLGSAFTVRMQTPIVLDDWSEPEPDIAVCQPDPDDYMFAHPRADQVLLLIEVAESSLPYDRRRKTAAYARSGVPEYWIINLVDKWIEIFSDPDPAAQCYRNERHATASDTVTLPGGSVLSAAALLPRS